MDTHRTSSYLLAAVCVISLTGCVLFSTSDEITLIFPTEPSGAAWTIRWLSDFGEVGNRTVEGNDSHLLTIPREIPLIIAAWPNVADISVPWAFKPAGFVQGTGERYRLAELNWENGFAAELLCDLAEGGVNLSGINVDRFVETVTERSSGRPWDIDRRNLVSDILDGSLWVYSVKLLEPREINLPLPPGTWYSTYPPDPPIIADESGWKGSLVRGLHQFMRSSDHAAATVWIDESDTPTVLIE